MIPALIDPGDYVLVPDPSFCLQNGYTSRQGRVHPMPLREEHGYRPQWSEIPMDFREQAKLMFLNYPGNPTAVTVKVDFFQEAVEFAARHQIAIAHDAAYQMITFDCYQAPSILGYT